MLRITAQLRASFNALQKGGIDQELHAYSKHIFIIASLQSRRHGEAFGGQAPWTKLQAPSPK